MKLWFEIAGLALGAILTVLAFFVGMFCLTQGGEDYLKERIGVGSICFCVIVTFVYCVVRAAEN